MAHVKQNKTKVLATGMGAIPVDNKGVTFRVWAPNAEKVSVVGDFNGWNVKKHPLKKENNGYWATYIPKLTTGADYKYALHTPYGTVLRNDPYARKMTNSDGNSVVCEMNFKWKYPDFKMDDLNKLVIYELHIGTFNREEKNKDKPGTFKSAAKKLSYLKALGINAIEIMPVAEFAGAISWGYNPAAPFALETDYGRPEVRRYIRDNAIRWLEDYNCDGLRWDATSYIRYVDGGTGYHSEEITEAKEMIQEINREIHQKFPGKILIAEDLKADHKVTTKGYDGLEFDTQWDSEFVHPVKEVLVHTEDASRNMQQVVNAVLFKYNDDVFQRVIYTESHDEVANGKARIPEEIQPGNADGEFAKKRSILGTVLVMTSPGIPMLFQGQEFLENEYFKDTDGLDWTRFSEFKGITKLYRDLIKLRASTTADHVKGLQGQHIHFLHFNQQNKVVTFSRIWAGLEETPVIVILNFSNITFDRYEIGIPVIGNWKILFNSSWEGYDKEDFNTVHTEVKVSENVPYDNQEHTLLFSIGGYSALILSKQKDE